MESTAAVPFAVSRSAIAADSPPPRAQVGTFQVVRRNGAVTAFDPTKTQCRAHQSVSRGRRRLGRRLAARARARRGVTARVAAAVTRRLGEGGACHIEDIQDQVELALMRAGEHKVARAYIVIATSAPSSCDERAPGAAPRTAELRVLDAAGELVPLDRGRLTRLVTEACAGLTGVSPEPILAEALRSVFDGMAQADVATALVMSARPLIEREPAYTFVTARLLLDQLRRERSRFSGKTCGRLRRPRWRRCTRSTFATSSRAASRSSCSTRAARTSISSASVPPSSRSATSRSPISASRPSTTAICSNGTARASSCRRRS